MPNNIPLSSLGKLNTMLTLSTGRDGKLNAGEVDAVAGFYGGLKPASQAKIKSRVIEIYQDSQYWRGQKERFFNLLRDEGMEIEELEGRDPSSVASFLRMSKAAQFEKMQDFVSEFSGVDNLDKTKPRYVPQPARDAIKDKVRQFVDQERADPNASSVWVESWSKVPMIDENYEPGKKVGYVVIVVTDYDGATGADAHYFNLEGAYLGKEYVGE